MVGTAKQTRPLSLCLEKNRGNMGCFVVFGGKISRENVDDVAQWHVTNPTPHFSYIYYFLKTPFNINNDNIYIIKS